MCGIVGYFDKNGKQNPPIGKILLSMLEALACRGPDSAGMAIFGPLRPKQLVARVKLGDREESSRSAPAVEEIARRAPKAKLVPVSHIDEFAKDGAGFAGFACGDV